MTASWRIQMGGPEVAVVEGGLDGPLETGMPVPEVPGLDALGVEAVDATALRAALEAGEATVVDFATSLEYRAGPIPGAWGAVRARLADARPAIGGAGKCGLTAHEPALAIPPPPAAMRSGAERYGEDGGET